MSGGEQAHWPPIGATCRRPNNSSPSWPPLCHGRLCASERASEREIVSLDNESRGQPRWLAFVVFVGAVVVLLFQVSRGNKVAPCASSAAPQRRAARRPTEGRRQKGERCSPSLANWQLGGGRRVLAGSEAQRSRENLDTFWLQANEQEGKQASRQASSRAIGRAGLLCAKSKHQFHFFGLRWKSQGRAALRCAARVSPDWFPAALESIGSLGVRKGERASEWAREGERNGER